MELDTIASIATVTIPTSNDVFNYVPVIQIQDSANSSSLSSPEPVLQSAFTSPTSVTSTSVTPRRLQSMSSYRFFQMLPLRNGRANRSLLPFTTKKWNNSEINYIYRCIDHVNCPVKVQISKNTSVVDGVQFVEVRINDAEHNLNLPEEEYFGIRNVVKEQVCSYKN